MTGSTDDDALYEKMAEVVQKLIESGSPPDLARGQIVGKMRDILYQQGEEIADELLSDPSEILLVERANADSFRAHLVGIWGASFDHLYLIGYAIGELADRFIRDNAESCEHDDLFKALTLLHERSRRVFWEVHCLVSGGFPGGALARARTLHELTITAMVLAKFARSQGVGDVATRYLDHTVVGELAQLRFEVALHEEQEQEVPLETTVRLDQLANLVAQLRAEYGNEFEKERGWAAPLLSQLPVRRRGTKRVPTIADLEFLADMGHMREVYAQLSIEVHAGSDGILHNLDPLGGELSSLIGPHWVGLAEPGRYAAWSLLYATWCLITDSTGRDAVPIVDLLSLKTLEAMIRRYIAVSDRAEEIALAPPPN